MNQASGSNLKVGTNLGPRTPDSEIRESEEFNLDGRRVVLIDTPGFGMIEESPEVLGSIATFLEKS